MKKVYSKPEIMFESFVMSTNIAGTCGEDIAMPTNKEGCGYQPEGYPMTVFLTDMSGCKQQLKPETDFNGICYDVPVPEGLLFNS